MKPWCEKADDRWVLLARKSCSSKAVRGSGRGKASCDGVLEAKAVQQRLRRTVGCDAAAANSGATSREMSTILT